MLIEILFLFGTHKAEEELVLKHLLEPSFVGPMTDSKKKQTGYSCQQTTSMQIRNVCSTILEWVCLTMPGTVNSIHAINLFFSLFP